LWQIGLLTANSSIFSIAPEMMAKVEGKHHLGEGLKYINTLELI
jgi:hypothetical protein